VTEEPVVLYDVDDGVAVITLNRPRRLNAWTPELGVAYFRALDRAAEDSAVRAIVVTGAGKGWCAGADMAVLDAITDGDDTVDGHRMSYPRTIPKLTVAAINGACAGLGFAHALYLDVRFAADDAKITATFPRMGLIAEVGIGWLLPRIVGLGRALDILATGRLIDPEEGLAMGLLTRVVPADTVVEAAVVYAREVARLCSPAAVATIKEQVALGLHQSFEDAEVTAAALVDVSLGLPDFAEGTRAFSERRDPDFAPLTVDAPLWRAARTSPAAPIKGSSL
jgi:enoyl-CoA hydratase/carnithine racemase